MLRTVSAGALQPATLSHPVLRSQRVSPTTNPQQNRQQLEHRAARLDRARWRELRQETKSTQGEILKRFRFRHKRQQFLDSLEVRWAAASPT